MRRNIQSPNRGQRLLGLRVDGTSTGLKEIFDVECVADVAASLNDTYFAMFDELDQEYHVALDVDGGLTYEAPDGVTLVPVAIAEDDTADTVAAAVGAAIDALAKFSAAVVTDTVTVTVVSKGAVTDAEDGDPEATGFIITVTQQGTDSTISILEGESDAVLTEHADDPGVYVLTFVEEFARVPSIVPTPLTADRNMIVTAVDVNSVTVKSVKASDQTAADADFHLLISGPML